MSLECYISLSPVATRETLLTLKKLNVMFNSTLYSCKNNSYISIKEGN